MPRKRKSIIENIQAEAAAEAKREDERRRVQRRQALQQENAILKDRISGLEETIADLEQTRIMVERLEAQPSRPYTFKARERSSRRHEAVACMVLSDLHFEERVDPEEINGVNEYNLEIARRRMERLAVGLVWLMEMARTEDPERPGYQIRDLYLPCLGDVTSNYLRLEDVGSNALAPMEAVVFAIDLLSAFVRTVLDRCPWLESVFMPIVPGNHDRLSFSRSVPYNKRVGMSSAPVLAHGITRELRDEPRFKLELSAAEHHYTNLYGHTIRGMHGDRFSYHGGVGGIFIPARRHIAGLNKARHAHVTLFGHWHTSKSDDLWVSNGSLIGPNAYSIGKGLDPEPPSQTFMLFDKARGKRLVTPVQVDGKEAWS